MNAVASQIEPLESTWARRVRSGAAVAAVWAALHFIVGGVFRASISGEPYVLLASNASPLFGILTAIVLIAGGVLIARVIGSRDPVRVFFLLGFGVALWLLEEGRQSGTMDQWLIANNPKPGPAVGRPYWLLVSDYVLLAVVILAVLYLNAGAAGGFLNRIGYGGGQRAGNEGITALMVDLAAGLLLVLLLMGARDAQTFRLQVYFAAFVGFWIATAIAVKVTGIQRFACYWPAPLIVGIGGLVVAGFRPGFPPPYDAINTLPSWAPTRGLPLEMAFLGIMGVCQALKMMRQNPPASEDGA